MTWTIGGAQVRYHPRQASLVLADKVSPPRRALPVAAVTAAECETNAGESSWPAQRAGLPGGEAPTRFELVYEALQASA